jgi:hypothetical protein
MRKLVCISDLTIRWENTDEPFVEWAELKEVFDFYDYLELVRFVAAKRIHCRREWLDINIISEFLEQRK